VVAYCVELGWLYEPTIIIIIIVVVVVVVVVIIIIRARQLQLRKRFSLVAYCSTLNCHSAQIQYPCVFYKETEVLKWGCAYIFWFNKQLPKNVVALTSQCIAAASDMLHCFSLHLAESAGWIPTKQARNSQMSSYRSMSSEDCNCHF
jgi:hypothetical protein